MAGSAPGSVLMPAADATSSGAPVTLGPPLATAPTIVVVPPEPVVEGSVVEVPVVEVVDVADPSVPGVGTGVVVVVVTADARLCFEDAIRVARAQGATFLAERAERSRARAAVQGAV